MTVSQGIDNLGGVKVFGIGIDSEIAFVERIEQGRPSRIEPVHQSAPPHFNQVRIRGQHPFTSISDSRADHPHRRTTSRTLSLGSRSISLL